jgi:hypothetical protein
MIAYHSGLCGRHIVAGGPRVASAGQARRSRPDNRGSGELQKMKNRGNEAKKWMKTKDITFFNGANYAHFARNFAQI